MIANVVAFPVQATSASAALVSAAAGWVTSNRRRRLWVSANRPAKGASSTTGANWLLLVSLVLFGAIGIAAASADAPTITGYPNQISQVNLSGYVLQTSYSLGANTGFTFQQTYGAKTVSAHAVPDDGVRYNSNYVAMPVGNQMLMVTWYLDNGTITDVFVMNFKTGVVSDVAPHPDTAAGAGPPSLGTVKVIQRGAGQIPPP